MRSRIRVLDFARARPSSLVRATNAEQTPNPYWQWFFEHVPMLYGALTVMTQWAANLQRPPAYSKAEHIHNPDEALRMTHEAIGGVQVVSGA
jgi:hypothetical protein